MEYQYNVQAAFIQSHLSLLVCAFKRMAERARREARFCRIRHLLSLGVMVTMARNRPGPRSGVVDSWEEHILPPRMTHPAHTSWQDQRTQEEMTSVSADTPLQDRVELTIPRYYQ